MPAVKVEIAFASNPTGGSYTWVDVSANVRKIQIRRGRQHVLNKFEPGSCTILFNARDGSLDPTNPSSPYYPNVDINRRIRIRAGASLTPIFTGFTDAWTPKWPNNVSADVEMTATDGLRLLAKGTFASSQYATQVLADSPQNFVPMTGIPPAAVTQLLYGALPPLAFTTLYDSVYPGDVNGTWALLEPYVAGVSGTSYVDPSTAVILSGGSLIGVESGSPAQVKVITSTSDFSVEFWVQWTDATPYHVLWAQTATDLMIGLATDSAKPGALVLWVDETFASGFAGHSVATTKAYNDGLWHHIVVTCNTSATPTYTLYVDGVQQFTYLRPRKMSSNSHWGSSLPRNFTFFGRPNWGLQTDTGLPVWQFGFWGTLANVALYGAGHSLSLAKVQNHYALGLSGFVVEDTGARITRGLTDAAWPAGDTSVQTGNTQVQTPIASLLNTSVLTYLQQIEDAEHGALFTNVSGVITFQNRYATLGLASSATLGDAAGQIPYKPGPVFALDNIDLYNQSQVQRLGGFLQIAQDSTSITKYGMASVLTESGLLTTSDADSLARAQWNVVHFAYPLPRMQSLVVDVLADVPNRFTQIALRELRDQVQVQRHAYSTPSGFPVAATFNQTNSIEGLEHQIDAANLTWMVTLCLSPAETRQFWILGDATNGVLGTSTALAY